MQAPSDVSRSTDHVQGSLRRSRWIALVGTESRGGGSRTDRGGRLDGRSGRRRRGGAARGRGRGVHRGPGGERLVGLRRPVQRVPRHRPRGHDRAAAVRRRVPEHLGGADHRRAVRVPARHDAPGRRGRAQRPVLHRPRGLHARVERRPARRPHPGRRRGGDDWRRRRHLRGAARRPGRRAAAAAGVAVRQPDGAARADPGDRRPPRRPPAGRLAELAAHPQRPRLQPPRPDHARQRRRSAARLVDIGPARQPPDDAARARRRHVPRQSRERRPGHRRGDRRRHLGIPRAPARGRAPRRHPHPRPLRRQALPRPGRRGPRRPRREHRRRGVDLGQDRLHAGLPPERGPRHRQRRRHHRHQRLRALHRADLLHHRPRPRHRGGAVAHLDHRAARRPQQRVVGRHAAVPARGRRLVDTRAATTPSSASSSSAPPRPSRGWRRAAA